MSRIVSIYLEAKLEFKLILRQACMPFEQARFVKIYRHDYTMRCDFKSVLLHHAGSSSSLLSVSLNTAHLQVPTHGHVCMYGESLD